MRWHPSVRCSGVRKKIPKKEILKNPFAPGAISRMITVTPLQFACSGKAPVSRAVYLSMSIALEIQYVAVNVCYAVRLRRSLSNSFLCFSLVYKKQYPYVALHHN